jgi:Uma2 family endonuclease
MTLAIPESISDYELERGKPMPSRNHGALELLIGSALLMKYAKTHSVFTEVTLDTAPPLTPDVAVAYPKIDLDWTQDEVRMSSPPLLIVEILLPSQTLNETCRKDKAVFCRGRNILLAGAAHVQAHCCAHSGCRTPRLYRRGY